MSEITFESLDSLTPTELYHRYRNEPDVMLFVDEDIRLWSKFQYLGVKHKLNGPQNDDEFANEFDNAAIRDNSYEGMCRKSAGKSTLVDLLISKYAIITKRQDERGCGVR